MLKPFAFHCPYLEQVETNQLIRRMAHASHTWSMPTMILEPNRLCSNSASTFLWPSPIVIDPSGGIGAVIVHEISTPLTPMVLPLMRMVAWKAGGSQKIMKPLPLARKNPSRSVWRARLLVLRLTEIGRFRKRGRPRKSLQPWSSEERKTSQQKNSSPTLLISRRKPGPSTCNFSQVSMSTPGKLRTNVQVQRRFLAADVKKATACGAHQRIVWLFGRIKMEGD